MKKWIFAILVIFFIIPKAFAQTQTQPAQIEIIFDASRSMLEASGGTSKLDAAKQALVLVANQIDSSAQVGLRAFGLKPVSGNVKESCLDSQLVIPIGPYQKEGMISRVMSFQANGNTPIGYSLQLAAKDFNPAAKKTIILISDGAESCDVDPVRVIQGLKAQGIEIMVHAIGFGVDAQASAQLRKVSELSGGTYVDAKDAGQLRTGLEKVAQKAELIGPQKEVGENLLAASAGGRIEYSSKDAYAQLIDGKEEMIGPLYIGEEAVFSFQNGQPVLIDTFAIPIFKQDNYNPQTISLMGSVEGPNAGFFPIKEIQVENKVFFGNVYQQFKIEPPVAVRFLKVIIGNCNTYCNIAELVAYGRYLSPDEFQVYLKQEEKREKNLLSPANGGQMIASTDPKMSNLIDGNMKDPGQAAEVYKDAEGIFGFKGGRSALITKIAVPVFQADELNLKKVEISVSESSPTSGYKPVGTFEVMNLAFAGNPYQEFAFEKPVKAKFLKVKIITFQNESRSWGRIPEIQAYGSLE